MAYWVSPIIVDPHFVLVVVSNPSRLLKLQKVSVEAGAINSDEDCFILLLNSLPSCVDNTLILNNVTQLVMDLETNLAYSLKLCIIAKGDHIDY